MSKFPVDAPKSKVIKTFEKLGFTIVREREHIAMSALECGWLKHALDSAQSYKD